jgi:hypothetical protein
MAAHHPDQFFLLAGWSEGAPVGYGDILYPAQVDDIADMPEHVDVFRLHFEGDFKPPVHGVPARLLRVSGKNDPVEGFQPLPH